MTFIQYLLCIRILMVNIGCVHIERRWFSINNGFKSNLKSIQIHTNHIAIRYYIYPLEEFYVQYSPNWRLDLSSELSICMYASKKMG